jgi:hypothetical protein
VGAAWSGEYTWPATDKPIYEYARREGNCAPGSILRARGDKRRRKQRRKHKSATQTSGAFPVRRSDGPWPAADLLLH